MSEPTYDELLAKIAALEAAVTTREGKPKRHRAVRSGGDKAYKAAQKARKAQFKLEAMQRKRLHCSINRYAR